MTEEGGRARRWLRPLGLFGITLALAVGSPFVLAAVPFALLSFLIAGQRLSGLFAGAFAFALVFSGSPGDGFWYVERGWALLVGGGFAAITIAWPHRSFVERGMLAVLGGAVWGSGILTAVRGWPAVEAMVRRRIEASASVTLEVMGGWAGEAGEGGLAEAVMRTSEIQMILFPALLSLSSIAALGVGWWMYVRWVEGSSQGLGSLRGFRFPDPAIWVLIAGVVLVLLAGWTEGAGRVGVNLIVFMASLFALRGAAVLLFVTGGVSFAWGILLAVGLFLAAPVFLTGAMMVGVGDSWLDLRARSAGAGSTGSDQTKE